MNVPVREKQIEVIAALCEGGGIRTAARLTGVNFDQYHFAGIGLFRPLLAKFEFEVDWFDSCRFSAFRRVRFPTSPPRLGIVGD